MASKYSVTFIATLLHIIFIRFTLVDSGRPAVEDDKIFTNTWAIRTDSEESAKRIAKRHNFVYKGKIGSLDGYFLLEHRYAPRRRRRRSDLTTRRLSHDPAILWSKQQLVLKRVKRGYRQPTDPLFKDQWYLENTGQANGPKGYDINVLPVWKKGITGKGVVVTILDDGIEYHHPDLQKNYDKRASYDYNSYDADPRPRYTERNVNKHGTRCAGEVAAAHSNNVCGSGVAYNARIGGIRMLDGEVTDALEASSLSLASEYIDIYSSSWGPEDKGVKVDGPAGLTKKVLREGVRKGRNNLGSIFVWATGNGGDYHDYCNCDGYITSIYTISIGAVNHEGKSPWYAEACPSTLAVTYSSDKKDDQFNKIVTTDLYDSCTKSHTGTSAAAPLAAGIFALVLEANRMLTWRDLQHLIVNTSRMTDENDSGWQINSAGYHVNNKYGFGVLDADALVTQAMRKDWKTVSEQHVCREVEPYAQNKRIRARGKFRSTIFSYGCSRRVDLCVTKLEHVTVYVTLQHERRGAIEINLISPSGTRSKLLGLRKFDLSTSGFNNWPFMTVFHWGESPVGEWTIEVDNKEDFVGTFKRWSLRLYGTCSQTRNNTVNEDDICDKLCEKRCPRPFVKVCPGCVKYCDCTTGMCTARCRRGLETDEGRQQCSYPADNQEAPNSSRDSQSAGRSLPRYGQWLLVAAGMAVSFGIVAGVWQGWLYYKTRRKLKRARDQERTLVSTRAPRPPHYCPHHAARGDLQQHTSTAT